MSSSRSISVHVLYEIARRGGRGVHRALQLVCRRYWQYTCENSLTNKIVPFIEFIDEYTTGNLYQCNARFYNRKTCMYRKDGAQTIQMNKNDRSYVKHFRAGFSDDTSIYGKFDGDEVRITESWPSDTIYYTDWVEPYEQMVWIKVELGHKTVLHKEDAKLKRYLDAVHDARILARRFPRELCCLPQNSQRNTAVSTQNK